MSNDFNGKILKAARVLLGLKQEDVVAELGIDRRILARLELSENQKVDVVLFNKFRAIYERRGIEFLPSDANHGNGVRFRSPENVVDGTPWTIKSSTTEKAAGQKKPKTSAKSR